MKRGLFIFGILYALFFAIPFPMLLYYNIKNGSIIHLEETNPSFALGVVILSVLVWIIVLTGYFRKWVLQMFSIKRNITRLKETGEHRQAKILDVTKTMNACELSLSFKNLVNTEIVQKLTVNDSKPHECRFEAGKKVDVFIDKEIKDTPYFILADTASGVNKKTVTLLSLGWLIFFGLVTAYYLYAYQSESEGMGWRFISFGHPLIICPVILLFYRMLITLIHKKLSSQSDSTALIKFKGIETTARLIKASQTGAYVNQQPMVNFELEYTDYRNRTHRQSLKKVVSLLNLDITKQEHVSIFYLKEDPAHIVFTSDLDKLN
jgi:hypothetical protein